MTAEIKAVLFDMGGVVVQLDKLETVLGPSAINADEIWERWILSEAVQQFEKGECTVQYFRPIAHDRTRTRRHHGAAHRAVHQLSAGPVSRSRRPRSFSTRRHRDRRAEQHQPLHWDHQIDADILKTMFDRSYLSYELGLAKPARGIYDYAVADLGLPAEHVLFIDDNQINVDGAQTAGLQAALAKGPAEATVALQDHRVAGI